MKTLLVNHFYYSISDFSTYEKFFDPIPVMGLGYLAAVLRRAGHDVKIIDDYTERLGIEGILEFIGEYRPAVVGTSCLTPLADETALLARSIKKRFPEITVVFGHRHADFFAEKIVSDRIADIVVHGEGERTLLEIADAGVNVNVLEKIEGITYWNGTSAVRNPNRAYIEDLDTIPFPAWDLFPLDKYKPCAEVMPGGKRHLPLLTSRGCPYACCFCTQEMGKKVRVRSPDNVVSEMRYVAEKLGVDGLILFDANFPMARGHAVDLCKEISRSGLPEKVRWTTETRPDRIDDELLDLMKRAGCTKIQIGFESASDRILKILDKGFTTSDSASAARRIKKAGLKLYGLFIIGAPTETVEEIHRTVRFAKSMDLDFAKFNLFVPYPGTAAYDDPAVKARINNGRFINYTSYPPSADRVLYSPEGIEPDRMLALQKTAFLSFYLRPRMIYRQVLKIKHISLKEYWNGLTFVLGSAFDLAFRHGRRRPYLPKTDS